MIFEHTKIRRVKSSILIGVAGFYVNLAFIEKDKYNVFYTVVTVNSECLDTQKKNWTRTFPSDCSGLSFETFKNNLKYLKNNFRIKYLASIAARVRRVGSSFIFIYFVIIIAGKTQFRF